MYVNGLGLIDDNYLTSKINNKAQAVQSTSNVSAFEKLLQAQTTKYASNNKEYTLEEIYEEAAEKYNVPKNLLEAIGYVESHFDVNAKSSAGAMGIMQLMPQTAASLGVTDAYDPYQNIMGAAKFLSKLRDMYDGDQNLMLAAYNAGSGNVAKYNGIPPFKSVQQYIAKVTDALNDGVSVSDNTTYLVNGANESSSAQYIYNSLYGNSRDLDSLLSYSQYETLMNFYTNMLEIISSIGDTDEDEDSFLSTDNSLNDLYNLSIQQRLKNL